MKLSKTKSDRHDVSSNLKSHAHDLAYVAHILIGFSRGCRDPGILEGGFFLARASGLAVVQNTLLTLRMHP